MIRDFFEFPLSRPFPFGLRWNLFTLIACVVVFLFLVVYSTATAGYDVITVSSSNYNLRLTGWYTVFRGKKTGICDKRQISVGEKVYTTDGVAAWTVMNWRERSSGEFLWSIDYAAEKIESCTLVELTMEPNMQTEVWTSYLSMNCTLGAYEVGLGADLVIPINVNIAAAQFAAVGFTKAKESDVSWNALFDLTMGFDGIFGLYAAAQGQSNYRLSTSLSATGSDFCGQDIVSDDMSKCRRSFQDEQTYTRWSSITSDISDRFSQPVPSQLNAPFNNFMVWVTQFAYWDLGLGSSTNLIRNYADRSTYLQRCTNCINANSLLDRQPGQIWFNGLVLPLTDPGFTPPTNQALNVQYLCRENKIKSPGDFVQAVLVATFSLFATFWAFYRTLWVFWGSHFGAAHVRRVFSSEPDPPSPSGSVSYNPIKVSSPSVTPMQQPQPIGYFPSAPGQQVWSTT